MNQKIHHERLCLNLYVYGVVSNSCAEGMVNDNAMQLYNNELQDTAWLVCDLPDIDCP